MHYLVRLKDCIVYCTRDKTIECSGDSLLIPAQLITIRSSRSCFKSSTKQQYFQATVTLSLLNPQTLIRDPIGQQSAGSKNPLFYILQPFDNLTNKA